MNAEEAKEILAASRMRDAAEDPRVREALQLAAGDPDLGAWWAEEQRFDEQMRSCLAGLEIPDGLREQILQSAQSGRRQAGPPRFAWFAAAALLTAVVGIASWWAFRPAAGQGSGAWAEAGAGEFDGFRQAMIGVLDAGPQLDQMEKDPERARLWLVNHGAPAGDSLPDVLTTLEGMGCKILEWKGNRVSLLCTKAKEGGSLHLFTVRREVFEALPPEELERVLVIGAYPSKGWVEGDHVQLLVAGNGARF